MYKKAEATLKRINKTLENDWKEQRCTKLLRHKTNEGEVERQGSIRQIQNWKRSLQIKTFPPGTKLSQKVLAKLFALQKRTSFQKTKQSSEIGKVCRIVFKDIHPNPIHPFIEPVDPSGVPKRSD